MTDQEWARRCIRGGFGCFALVLVLVGILGGWLCWLFYQWAMR